MLNRKKAAKWISVLAAVLVIITGLVCLTNAGMDGKLSAKGQEEKQETNEQTEKVEKNAQVFSEEPHTLVFENMNMTIELPENKEWIQNPVASVDEKTGVVTYYDRITETDVTLRFGKKGQKNISKYSDNDSDRADEYWSYFTGNKERLIQIRFYPEKNDMTAAVLSWSYGGVQFYLYADFSDSEKSVKTNWSSLAKTAAYIAENWHKIK